MNDFPGGGSQPSGGSLPRLPPGMLFTFGGEKWQG